MRRPVVLNTNSAPQLAAWRLGIRLLMVGILLATMGLRAAPIEPPANLDLTELPLEALMNLDIPKVYGASKIEQAVSEAPSSVTIVTADEIKKQGYRSLADVLRSVQGMEVSYDRSYSFLGTRGLNLGDFNDRVLVLVNGHRINNNYNDGAFLDAGFPLNIDLVEKVEVIRGPGSVMYGNNAFFGVINVVPRTGKQLNGVETSAEYGSFNSYQLRATYGRLFTNEVEVLVSGNYGETDGEDRLVYKEFNSPAQNQGVAEDMDSARFGEVFSSISFHDLSLDGGFSHREKINPTAQYDLTRFNDPRLETIDERAFAALKYEHIFPSVGDVTARLYYDHYQHQMGFPQAVLAGDVEVFSRYSKETDIGDWWGAELQLNKELWERHMVTVGGEFRDDFVQESRIEVKDDPTGGLLTRTTRQSYGLYAQGDFSIVTNLHLVAGLRFDQCADFDGSWNPRLAMIYHPGKTSTFKALYGTAFRAPSFYEISTSDHALVPEEITSYELVYEQQIGAHLRSSLSGFYNEMNDLLVFSSGTFVNFDANSRGGELALEAFWSNGIHGRASYSLQQTRNDTTGWKVPDSPNHLVKLNVSVPIWKDRIFAGLQFRFVSDRRSLHDTTDADGQPLTVQGAEAGAYGLVDLTLFSQNLVKNLEASATVYNVLDRRYADPASRFHTQDLLEQDGRTFRVKLTYRF